MSQFANLPTLAFWTRTDRSSPALICPDGSVRTVGQLLDAAHQLSRTLREAGVGRGDVVAYCLRNGPEIFEIILATSQIGAYYTPISWHLTAYEIQHILIDSGAKVVVAGPETATLCLGTQARVYAVGSVSEVSQADAEPRVSSDQPLPYEQLKTGSTEPPPERWAGGVMTYTSGTTGKPKGVRRPLPQAPPEPIASAFASFLLLYGMTPGKGVHLVTSPLYHTAVVYFAINCLHLGHAIVIMEKWSAVEMLELVQTWRVTNSHMVPTQLVRLLEVPDRARYDVSSLQHMVHSAAPCPVSVKKAILDWWGPVLYEYYAAGEGGGTMVTPTEWLARPGTVGKPWPTAGIKIFSDQGQELPPGEVGTVYIKMLQGFEYHRDKAKTEQAWRPDGYFTVGDAGYLDSDGYLFLCDRKADLIISGGVNIYPAEVEGVLAAHPAVADVAVFGIPDDTWGEQVKAVIQLRCEPTPAVEAELLAWASERLARFKQPRSIDFVAEMPRDPNGKLRKRLLRAPYWEKTGRAI